MGLNYGTKYTFSRAGKSMPHTPTNKIAVDIYDFITKELLESFDSITDALGFMGLTDNTIRYYGTRNRGKELDECKRYKDIIIYYNIKNVI